MSWDFYVTSKPCPTCGHREAYESDVGFDNNYTSNMFPMLKKAGFDWDEIQNRPTTEALPKLERLIDAMKADPQGYKALNPPNGWGDYDGFLRYLERMALWCRNRPDGYIEVSR